MAERDWTEIFTTAGVTSCSSGARVGTPFLLSAKGKPECAGNDHAQQNNQAGGVAKQAGKISSWIYSAKLARTRPHSDNKMKQDGQRSGIQTSPFPRLSISSIPGSNVSGSKALIPIRKRFVSRLEPREIVKPRIGQMGRLDILQCGKHCLQSAGKFFIPLLQHFLHRLALHIFLRSAQIARNDGEIFYLGILRQIFFLAVSQVGGSRYCVRRRSRAWAAWSLSLPP